jgi:exopolyphosphatase/guanosine-5'-triphosphate,3'-diphosphate pyrophosphatase
VAPSPSDSNTVCGLDIGSNTITCAEIGISAGGTGITVLGDTSIVTRLSESLQPGGALDPQAITRSLAALEQLAESFGLRNKPLRAVGTQVLRMTADPTPFIRPAEQILGTRIEIVDGEHEALLVARGAILGIGGEGPFTVVDVGGQSTEVCWQAGQDWRPQSLPMGVVGLTRRFLKSDPPLPAEVAALNAFAREAIASSVPAIPDGRLIAVAGTATTLAMLELGLETWDRDQVHGVDFSRERLGFWLARMLEVGSARRTERYRVRPGRADVFPAGLLLVDALLAHTRSERFTVSANGLRIGAALTLLEG